MTRSSDTERPQRRELRLPASRNPHATWTRLRTGRVPMTVYIGGLLLIPVLVVGTAMATGLWAVSGRTTAAGWNFGGTGSGQGQGEGQGTGQGAGQGGGTGATGAVSDIRGRTTVQDIVDAFPPLTVADVLDHLDAPPGTPADTEVRELLEVSGKDMPDLRTWVETTAAAG